MRELRLEIIRATPTRVKRIEVIPIKVIRTKVIRTKVKRIKVRPIRVQPIKAIPIAAMLTRHTPAQGMPVLRRYARTGTIPIIPMPARRTVSTVRNGSLAERLSVSVPGITGDGDTADTTVDTMVALGTTDAVTTDAAITDTVMSADEDTPADMQVTMRTVGTSEADTVAVADTAVAAQFMAALAFTAVAVVASTVAAAVAFTVAVDMAAVTGNPVALES